MQAFTVDVRPALDSVGSAMDRLKMGIYVWCSRLGVPCPVTGMHPTAASAATVAVPSSR